MQASPGMKEAWEKFKADFPTRGADIANKVYGIGFGLSGLVGSGTNATAQFVGSFNVRFTPLGDGNALIRLSNATTVRSLLYDTVGSREGHSSTSFAPYSTYRQLFVWIEKIPVN